MMPSRPVVQAVARVDGAWALVPQVPAVVGTDVTVEAAVVVRLENVQNTRIPITAQVAGLREVSVWEMFHVPDVGEGDAVAMLAHDVRHVVVGIGVQAARAQGQAVVGVVHHRQEVVDGRAVHQQTGQTKDIPGGDHPYGWPS